MATFRFYPRLPNAKKSSIQLRIRSGAAGGDSIKIGTGIVIKNPAKSWDCKNDRMFRSYSQSQPINMRLAEIRAKAEELFYHAEASHIEHPIQYVKQELQKSPVVHSGKKSATKTSESEQSYVLIDAFDRFCDAKKEEYAESTLKSYQTTRMHLVEFDAKTGRSSIANGVNAEWVDAFRRYLRNRGLSDNSLRRSLKILKTSLKWADERGLISDTSYIKAIKLGNEKESVTVALTKEQLDMVEKVDLNERPALNIVRWWFLAQCSTGVRFADLHRVTLSNIKNQALTLQPKKTKDHFVKLPVSPLLRRALENIGDNVLNFSSQHYNRMLKELGRLLEFDETVAHVRFKGGKRIENNVPMHELLTSHTARRTFITILLRAGNPQEVVMKLSGHNDVRSFRKYVKMTDDDAVDAVVGTFG